MTSRATLASTPATYLRGEGARETADEVLLSIDRYLAIADSRLGPSKPVNTFTLAHVTHEAVEHVGGIGTVLAGLISSPIYRNHVKRSILVGPTGGHLHTDPEGRLGPHGRVLYSSIDKLDRANLAGRFRPVESAFNVGIVYGSRTYHLPDNNHSGEAEVLLVDVFQINPDRLNLFKLHLWKTFGLDSSRYDKTWDYEEYIRLAEPAYHALTALLKDTNLPCVLISHEFMGMPAALQVILSGRDNFRTVFYAHECATARHLVENHPGHDTMFYNVLDRAREQQLYVRDVFGDLDHLFRHALVKRSHLCDGVVAVGNRTRDELKFLDSNFENHNINLVYNGLPNGKVDLKNKTRSRRMLQTYAANLLDYEPEVLMTHIARPVISKGFWRDLKVCHALEDRLQKMNRTGVLFILTSGGGIRNQQEILLMEQKYGWPRRHKPGYPDLVGPEQDLFDDVEAFNEHHKAIQVVLVNQFGWSRERIGRRLPAEMTITDLRRGTDVEFGMATYEPFGISPLEPLGAGAICVISSVCGCQGFVHHVTDCNDVKNIIEADFTRLENHRSIDELRTLSRSNRDDIEDTVADQVADDLMRHLPIDDDNRRQALIDSGQILAARMSWDKVIDASLLPMLDRITWPCKKG